MLQAINKKIIVFAGLITLVLCISGCGNNKTETVLVEGNAEQNNEDTVQESGDVSDTDTETFSQSDLAELEEIESQADVVTVYVCGAVVAPGVYELSTTSIKRDALNKAGGFAEGASNTYVNLAEPVYQGEKIYFPYEAELEPDYSPLDEQEDAQGDDSHKININTATKDELMTLSGIGESKALDIISYREEHGGFNSIEEIMNINGIKEGVYNKIRDNIVVD